MPTLDWLNRAAAFKIAKEVPYRFLELVSSILRLRLLPCPRDQPT